MFAFLFVLALCGLLLRLARGSAAAHVHPPITYVWAVILTDAVDAETISVAVDGWNQPTALESAIAAAHSVRGEWFLNDVDAQTTLYYVGSLIRQNDATPEPPLYYFD